MERDSLNLVESNFKRIFTKTIAVEVCLICLIMILSVMRLLIVILSTELLYSPPDSWYNLWQTKELSSPNQTRSYRIWIFVLLFVRDIIQIDPFTIAKVFHPIFSAILFSVGLYLFLRKQNTSLTFSFLGVFLIILSPFFLELMLNFKAETLTLAVIPWILLLSTARSDTLVLLGQISVFFGILIHLIAGSILIVVWCIIQRPKKHDLLGFFIGFSLFILGSFLLDFFHILNISIDLLQILSWAIYFFLLLGRNSFYQFLSNFSFRPSFQFRFDLVLVTIFYSIFILDSFFFAILKPTPQTSTPPVYFFLSMTGNYFGRLYKHGTLLGFSFLLPIFITPVLYLKISRKKSYLKFRISIILAILTQVLAMSLIDPLGIVYIELSGISSEIIWKQGLFGDYYSLYTMERFGVYFSISIIVFFVLVLERLFLNSDKIIRLKLPFRRIHVSKRFIISFMFLSVLLGSFIQNVHHSSSIINSSPEDLDDFVSWFQDFSQKNGLNFPTYIVGKEEMFWALGLKFPAFSADMFADFFQYISENTIILIVQTNYFYGSDLHGLINLEMNEIPFTNSSQSLSWINSREWTEVYTYSSNYEVILTGVKNAEL